MKILAIPRLPNLPNDPPGGEAGQRYFNTTTNNIRFHNGSIWQDEGVGAGAGAGPNPTDNFAVRVIMPESNTAPTDDLQVAFTFPDDIATAVDAMQVKFNLPETIALTSDSFQQMRLVTAETVSAMTDALSLGVTFTDSNVVPTDGMAVRIQAADSTAAPTDSLTRIAPSITDSNAAPSDSGTFVVRPTYTDTNVAPTETVRLHLRSNPGDALAEKNDPPSDSSRATVTWLQGATTAAASGSGWTNPTNAQGLNNGTQATFSDSAIQTNSGNLTLDPYPDLDASMSGWTYGINAATLQFFLDATFSALPTATVNLEWSLNGTTWTTLDTITASGNWNTLATSAQFGLGTLTFTQINNIRSRVRITAGLVSETLTVNVDAVRLQVIATKNPL